MKNKSEEVKKEEMDVFYPNDSYIATDDELFYIAPLPNINTTKYEELNPEYAYINDDYYYLLRGKYPLYKDEITEPGLYNKNGTIVVHMPSTDDEKEKYDVKKAILNTSKEEIIEVLKSKDKIFISVPEGSNIFSPGIETNDDILKRAIKKVLLEKNVDIDLYKHRFTDKNALLNFKQVMKSNSKLSMLLFERGCDVLNLKYTIIIEEASPDDNVGLRLKEPIIVKSDEEFSL